MLVPKSKGAKKVAQISLFEENPALEEESDYGKLIELFFYISVKFLLKLKQKMQNKPLYLILENAEEYESEEEVEIIVNPNKKCKKNYTRFVKSIQRGITTGLKKGVKEAVDQMDLSFLETTKDAIAFIMNDDGQCEE